MIIMRNAKQMLRKAIWPILLLPSLLLAGCHGGLDFPWSQTPETHESQLEHVTAANFDERVLKCDKPVLVDFYAEWCGPCKKLGPVLEDFAKDHPEIRVVKVDVDKNSELTSRYGVQSMPTLIVFRDGKTGPPSVGLVPKEYLAELTQAKPVETAIR